MTDEEKVVIKTAFHKQNLKIKEMKEMIIEQQEFIQKQNRYVLKIRTDLEDQIEQLSKIVLDHIERKV